MHKNLIFLHNLCHNKNKIKYLIIFYKFSRVERNRNMQKPTKAVVLKVADTHFEQLLFYNFPKF
jgi:hypothetical protein